MDYDIVLPKGVLTGNPILFLHGWGGNKESFAFAKNAICDRKLVFVSFAGHGASGAPKRPFCVADFANEVIELLDKLDTKKVDIVAHSFGGRVALVLAAQHPERVGKMLLVGCAGLRPHKSLKVRAKIAKFKIKKWLVRLRLLSHHALEGAGSADYQALAPEMRETFKRVVNQNLAQFAKKVKTETLLVFGECDTETPLWMGKKLNRLIQNSALVVFENCGHFCFYQEPVRFCLILKSFFVS